MRESIIRRTLGLFKSLHINIDQNVNGRNYTIPVAHDCVGVLREMNEEPWMGNLIKLLLDKKKGSFIDVGVNVGQTLLKLKALPGNVAYYGFEPNSNCVAYVEKLISLNKLTAADIVPIGLSADNAICTLNSIYSNIDSSATIIDNFRPNDTVTRKQYVPVFAFDNILTSLGISNIALIKIDVEGAESDVLKGMRQTILTQKPFIIVEILPCYSEVNTDRVKRQEEILQLVQELHYHIYRVMKTGSNIELVPIQTIEIHSDIELCDYVLSPVQL